MTRSILVFVLSIFLFSCVAVPEKKESADLTINPITFIIPKDINLSVVKDNQFSGLHYNEPSLNRGSSKKFKYFDGYNINSTKSNITVTKIKGYTYYLSSGPKTWTGYIKYFVNINLEDMGNYYRLELNPVSKEKFLPSDISSFRKKSNPKGFSDNKLKQILSNPVFSYSYELDSPYNSDSTYANFKRLLQQEYYDKPVKDEVTGKIYKSRYLVPYENGTAKVHVETYPYRNGSKAVLNFTFVGGQDNGTIISIEKNIIEIKAALKKVIEN